MIRKANIFDLNGILNVISDAKELFRNNNQTQWQDLDGYPNAATFITDFLENIVLVKLENDLIVGVLVLSKKIEECYNVIHDGNWLSEDRYYVIHRLAVKKEYYHKGIAASLIKEAEKLTLEDNVKSIRIDTHEQNQSMMNLLKKLGYSRCGKIYLLRPDVIDKERIAFNKLLYK